MSGKSIKIVLANTLADLSKDDLSKFVHYLRARPGDPKITRHRVDGKGYLDIADVLVSAFTETGAVKVAEEILRTMDCSNEADELVKAAGSQPSKPGPSEGARPSGGAAGADTGMKDQHFVDKHMPQLIQRVRNIDPILDDLLHLGVLQDETYDKIRAESTYQEKMRALYRGPLNAGEACNDIFYMLLEKHEPFLVKYLKTLK
ncbi:apoptosis-associated speck-like protein containing a CARD [Aulostomus maculatus]